MKIKITEVWNGGSAGEKTLAIIETVSADPKTEVFLWVRENRPDLELSTSIYSHGFHAKEEN